MTKTYLYCVCERNLSAVTMSRRWRNRGIAVVARRCWTWRDYLVVAVVATASPYHLCTACVAESAIAIAVNVIVTAMSPVNMVVTNFHAWSRSSSYITPSIAVRVCVSCHCESCKSESHHCCLHNRIVFRG